MSATLPGDLARWTFWVGLRGVIHPSLPGLINALGTGWRLRWASAQEDRTLMEDEYRRWLGDTLTDQGFQTLVRHAYRSTWRVHLEELLLSRLGPNNIDDWAQFRGEDRLREALSDGQGVVLVYPHAGPVMLMIAALAHKGFPYVQYAARGLPPADMARAHPDLLAHSWLRAAVREARESHENCLDVEYLTLDAPVRTLHRRLADNHIVGIAFDGRIGSGWAPMPFLNRTALLSPGPWKLACSTGATVLPVFCHTPDGEPATIEVGQPLRPGKDWRAVATSALAQQESWLRRHPEEYGVWLLHTRQRAGIDDHPLFVDTATDARYRCWMPDE